MSLEKKLRDAALAAAIEATTNERARCLWCIDVIIEGLKKGLSQKLFESATIEQLRKVKLQIAEALGMEVRRAIVSGARPVSETGQVRGVADSSGWKCQTCDRAFDDPRGCDKTLVHPTKLEKS